MGLVALKDTIYFNICIRFLDLPLAPHFLSRMSYANSGASMPLYFARLHKLFYGLDEMSTKEKSPISLGEEEKSHGSLDSSGASSLSLVNFKSSQ